MRARTSASQAWGSTSFILAVTIKRQVPGGADADIKEFLADVTSLANTNGGDLVFGIDEVDGTAAGLQPVSALRAETDLLRLENLLRDGVEPRLPSARLRWIEVGPEGGVILIRVQASFSAPHRVKFKNFGRFYARNSRGKFEMDTFELRQAFTASEQLPTRVRALHDEAVAAAFGAGRPFRLAAEPAAIVTILPLSYLRESGTVGISFENALLPRPGGGFEFLNTLEGVLVHTSVLPRPRRPDPEVASWALSHWRGRMDAAWTVGEERDLGQGKEVRIVWPKRFEDGLLDAGRSTVSKLGALGIEGPWAVLTSITGIKGFELVLGDHETSPPAWRDQAVLPDLVLDHIDGSTLQPIFEAFWLLFGELRANHKGA